MASSRKTAVSFCGLMALSSVVTRPPTGPVIAAAKRGFCRSSPASSVEPERGRPEMKWMRGIGWLPGFATASALENTAGRRAAMGRTAAADRRCRLDRHARAIEACTRGSGASCCHWGCGKAESACEGAAARRSPGGHRWRSITVTTAADVVDANDGVLSLREAVAQANASAGFDEIEFAASLEGATLVLTGGELVVSGDLAIDGDVTRRWPRHHAQRRRCQSSAERRRRRHRCRAQRHGPADGRGRYLR